MLKLSVPSFQTRKYWKNMLSVVEKIETKVHGVHRHTDGTDILRATALAFLFAFICPSTDMSEYDRYCNTVVPQ